PPTAPSAPRATAAREGSAASAEPPPGPGRDRRSAPSTARVPGSETRRRADDLAAVGREGPDDLLDGQHGLHGGLLALYHRDPEVDDVAMRHTARHEGEATGADVEPLAVDEDGHLAPEDVERLLLIDVDMQRRGGAARVDALHLREAAGRLLAGRLARAA